MFKVLAPKESPKYHVPRLDLETPSDVLYIYNLLGPPITLKVIRKA